MSPQEIQALIDAKIAGQGSAVDIGGALPQILSGILELAATPPEKHVLEILSVTTGPESIEDTLARMKLDGRDMKMEYLNKLDVLNTYIVFNGEEYAITRYRNDEGLALISAGFASVVKEVEATLDIQLESGSTASFINYSEA